MGRLIDKSNDYSSLTPEFKFNPSCTIKPILPFINMTLKPARKLKYDSRNNECEVDNGNN